MSFNPAIPQPNNIISQSQQDLLTNNIALDNVFGIDHYKFSSATNSGTHQKISFPLAQSADPAAPTNPASFLYTKQAGSSLISQLFFENSGGVHQLTGSSVAAANGYTSLMGGIILQWGLGSGGVSPGVTNNFPLVFPNACFSVVATVLNSGNTPRYVSEVTGAAVNGFVAISTNAVQIYYMAIGY